MPLNPHDSSAQSTSTATLDGVNLDDLVYESRHWWQSPQWILIFSGLGILLLIAGVLGWRFTHFPAFNMDPRANVQAAPVITRTIPEVYETVGTLMSDRLAKLHPETPALVQKIHVNEGQWVKAGTVLITLKQQRQQAEVQETSASVLNAQIQIDTATNKMAQSQFNLDAAQSRLKLAQADYQRYQNLFQKDFVSQQDLDQKKAAYDEALAQFESAQKQITIDHNNEIAARAYYSETQSRQRGAQARFQETVIRAPFDGQVGTRRVNVGDYVTTSTELISVVQDNPVKLEVQVPQRFLNRLSLQTVASFHTEADPDTAYKGVLNYIAPAMDEVSQTVLVKAVIENNSHSLKPGQYGHVQLELGQFPNALLVPEQCLVALGGQFFVYKVVESKGQYTAKLTQVQTGLRQRGLVQITQGLTASDQVVTGGLQFVTDGIGLIIKGVNDTPPPTSSAKAKSGAAS